MRQKIILAISCHLITSPPSSNRNNTDFAIGQQQILAWNCLGSNIFANVQCTAPGSGEYNFKLIFILFTISPEQNGYKYMRNFTKYHTSIMYESGTKKGG